jgi:predicted nucleic acid-binding protein
VSETPSEVVLDASAALTGLFRREGSASDVVHEVVSGVTAAHVPDLFVAEVTNAMALRVRAGRWPLASASRALALVLAWPLAVQSCLPLAEPALESATRLGLSAYDAYYAVLSRELAVPLVTADRQLGTAVPGAILVA